MWLYIEREKLLKPKNDYVFKRIFGYIGNEDITEDFLSKILDEKITNVKLDKSTVIERDLLDDKLGILDIRATINDKINIDIEMQIVNQRNIEKRILYYWSKMYSREIRKKEDYEKLQKTIIILISEFNLENLKEIRKYITKWNIREQESSQTILTDMLEIYIIEIPKFREGKDKNNTKKELNKWLDFIDNPEVISLEDENEKIAKARKILDDLSNDPKEIYLAELRLKNIMDKKAIEDYGFDKGKKDIIKKMKSKNIDIELICEITGLTKKEVENI